MQQDISNKIGNATKWSSVAEIGAKLVTPIVNMVLARVLTPEAFGVAATITMVISFAEIFTDAGFQKYIIQHEFKNDNELNRSTNVAFWTNFVVSALICLGIFLFRHQLADIVGSPGLGNSISVASLLIMVASVSSIQMARYKREFDFKTLFFVRLGITIIPLIVTVPLAFIMRNYWALLIGNISSQIFNAIILTWKSKWKPSFYYSFSLLKEMFSFSAWTLLESIAIWLTSYIGIFIVGSYLNEYYLGIYKTSMSTVGSFMSIITSAITPVLFSALSRYQNNETMFQKTYFDAQKIIAVIVFPIGAGLFLFRDVVTSIMLGSQWMEASGFIGMWGLTSAVAIVFSHFASEVFRSKGNPKLSLLAQIMHLAFIIPTLLLTVTHEFEVLYTARSLIRIQMILTMMIFMQVFYKIRISDTVKNVLPMMLSTCIMGVAGYALRQISDNSIWNWCSIFLCIVIYFAVLLGCFPKLRRELMETEYAKIIMIPFRKRSK